MGGEAFLGSAKLRCSSLRVDRSSPLVLPLCSVSTQVPLLSLFLKVILSLALKACMPIAVLGKSMLCAPVYF
jgi:hypothetical protein